MYYTHNATKVKLSTKSRYQANNLPRVLTHNQNTALTLIKRRPILKHGTALTLIKRRLTREHSTAAILKKGRLAQEEDIVLTQIKEG